MTLTIAFGTNGDEQPTREQAIWNSATPVTATRDDQMIAFCRLFNRSRSGAIAAKRQRGLRAGRVRQRIGCDHQNGSPVHPGTVQPTSMPASIIANMIRNLLSGMYDSALPTRPNRNAGAAASSEAACDAAMKSA